MVGAACFLISYPHCFVSFSLIFHIATLVGFAEAQWALGNKNTNAFICGTYYLLTFQ